MKQLCLLLLIVLIGCIPTAVYGGSAWGVVRDTEDKPVPLTLLGVVDIKTGQEFSTVSNQKGEYILKDVPPGVYDFVVSIEGVNVSINQVPLVVKEGRNLKADGYLDRRQVRKFIRELKKGRTPI